MNRKEIVRRVAVARSGSVKFAPDDSSARSAYLVGALMSILSDVVDIDYSELDLLTTPEGEQKHWRGSK